MNELISNIYIEGETADGVWLEAYELLNKQHLGEDSRVGKIRGEILNASLIIRDPTRGIILNKVRKMSIRYAVGELLWYLAGNNITHGINKYTKVWDDLADESGFINSNYGYCIQNKFGFNQLDRIIEQLVNNKNTRQAIIHIKGVNDDIHSKDINCTLTLQFLIRQNKLYMTTNMRSNDIWLGTPFDIFNFTALQVYLSMLLNCELGNYTHNVASLHLYEKDADKGKVL